MNFKSLVKLWEKLDKEHKLRFKHTNLISYEYKWQMLTIRELSYIFWLSYSLIYNRIKVLGWRVSYALHTPARKNNKQEPYNANHVD